jgi:exopolysaccharide biosynthesis polyprenyl glycosylphosphotransferase
MALRAVRAFRVAEVARPDHRRRRGGDASTSASAAPRTGRGTWPRALVALAAAGAPLLVVDVLPGQAAGLAPSDPGGILLGLVTMVAIVVLGETEGSSARFTGLVGSAVRVVLAVALGCWAATAGGALTGSGVDTVALLWVWALGPAVFLGMRALLLAAAGNPPARTLVIGSGVVGRRLAELAARHPESGVDVVGRVDVSPDVQVAGEPRWLGTLDELPAVLDEHGIDRVVVAYSQVPDGELAVRLRSLADLPVQVDVVPRLFDLVSPGHGERIGPLGLIPVGTRLPTLRTLAVKRGFDVVVAATLLLVLAFPLALVVAAIWAEDRGSPLYRQSRRGRYGVTFRMLKFRTMVRGADQVVAHRLAELRAQGYSVAEANDLLKAKDDPRITRVGRFLRATSIDELPQLWNVLKGDMSIVGPRPLPLYEAAAVSGWQLKRDQVRPGLTGLWQVMGRSDTRWDERMALDCRYVQRLSLLEDMRILGRTVRTVAGRGGAR